MQKTRTAKIAAMPLVTMHRAHTAGVNLSIDAGAVLASQLAAGRFREQVFAVLTERLPLAVRVAGLAAEAHAEAMFAQVCTEIAAAVAEAQSAVGAVEIAVSARALAPRDAWLTRQESLGKGALYMLADESMLRPDSRCDGRERYDAFWEQLWRLRSERFVRAAYAPHVKSLCPLLCGEKGDAIVPSLAIQAPSGSAWVAMRLDLPGFADAGGTLREDLLQKALQHCVDSGEAVHEQARWATAGMRHDGWLNRRLAIEITGIGDLVVRRGHDPRQFACLQNLCDLLRWVQAVLHKRSRAIAARAGCVPALGHINPIRALPGGHNRDSWCQRWRAALEQHAIRHRNMLVLSPWSVFPTRLRPDAAFLDLLPLIDFADACAFPRPPPLQSWNINDFRNLHQRAWAVLEHNGARQLIAEQV
ncbi:MAG: hypothetical protein OEO82_09370 [Gammaproteobacteria bacterium]|nr:hypothetical protein [Gammaproteobacteria bacterium]